MGGAHVHRLAAVFDHPAGVVLHFLRRIIVDRLAGLLVEAGSPVHLGEGLAAQELAVGAVEDVVEAVAIGLRDHLAHLAADVDVVELGDGDGVVVPALVGDGLEIPFQLPGIDVERDDRARVEIVAGAPLRVEHVHGIAGAEIGEVRLGIEGRLRPYAAAAERDGARIGPGLRARLARLRNHREAPQELAGVGGIGGDVAAAALVAPGRADQDLVLDREWRRRMAGARRGR